MIHWRNRRELGPGLGQRNRRLRHIDCNHSVDEAGRTVAHMVNFRPDGMSVGEDLICETVHNVLAGFRSESPPGMAPSEVIAGPSSMAGVNEHRYMIRNVRAYGMNNPVDYRKYQRTVYEHHISPGTQGSIQQRMSIGSSRIRGLRESR